LALLFNVQSALSQTRTRVDVTTAGAVPNQDGRAAMISADGRYVVFESEAANLVPNDWNDSKDIFVRDLQTLATTRVNLQSDGLEAWGGSSWGPSISADGRYVAFASSAGLVPMDTNGSADIYVRDRAAGTTTIVSLTSEGKLDRSTNCIEDTSISSDGRYVAFACAADLTDAWGSSGPSYPAIFVRDRVAGKVELISYGFDGTPEYDGDSPRISANGRFVAYRGATGIVKVYDRLTKQTEQVSFTPSGHSTSGQDPEISGEGRFVVYMEGRSSSGEILRYDRSTGRTTVVSVTAAGAISGGYNTKPAISADGRYVAFATKNNAYLPYESMIYDAVVLRDVLVGLNQVIYYALPDISLSADGAKIVFEYGPIYLLGRTCIPDSDLDGSPDCADGCPADRSKTAPGACGCGVPDVDANGNGVIDCLERPTPDNKCKTKCHRKCTRVKHPKTCAKKCIRKQCK
jgi:Tol biopolymer transport system component